MECMDECPHKMQRKRCANNGIGRANKRRNPSSDGEEVECHDACCVDDVCESNKTVEEGAKSRAKKLRKPTRRFTGFDRTGLPIRWNNLESYRFLRDYLRNCHCTLIDDDYSHWKAKTKVLVRCDLCETTSKSALNNLQTGHAIACFCSGKMALLNPQYYNALCKKEVCERVGRYTAFHRSPMRVVIPSREVFLKAATKGLSTLVHGLTCADCGTTSNGTTLASLQQGHGIACFCSGQMRLYTVQYYDAMCNADLCNKLNCFQALHRTECRVLLPSRDTFLQVQKTQCNGKINGLVCSNCGTVANDTELSNLRSGSGIACFCSGHMRRDTDQFYDAMCNADLCNKLNCFQAFHRTERRVSLPTRDAFMKAMVAGDTFGGLTCADCGVSSNGTSIGSLRQGQGIACFCSGKMRLTDPQFYDSMQNKELCTRLGWFEALHRSVQPLELPDRATFLEAVSTGGNDARIPGLRCTECNTTGSTDRNSLCSGRSIACKCTTPLQEQWLFSAFSNHPDFTILGTELTNRSGITVECGQRRLRLDLVVKHVPSGRIGWGEADGIQHFTAVPFWNTVWSEVNERDQIKVDAVMSQGVTPPCTDGAPIDFIFRISYRQRKEAQCRALMSLVANKCVEERFVCLTDDASLYDERGVPLLIQST